MPCLITTLSDNNNKPRYMTVGGIFDAYVEEIALMFKEINKKTEANNYNEKEKLDLDILYTMMDTVNEWVVVENRRYFKRGRIYAREL